MQKKYYGDLEIIQQKTPLVVYFDQHAAPESWWKYTTFTGWG